MQKIFWLLDPFEKPRDAAEAAAWSLGLAEALGAPIQPLHVLSGGSLAFNPEIHAAWIMQVAIQAEDRMKNIVSKLKVPHLLPPIVLSEIYRSRSEAVAALLEYARENEAGILVLERHSGARRTRKIGGFAETLLLKSEIPVLVVGRHPEKRGRALRKRVPKRIVLGVDLEADPQPLIRQVTDWARRLKARVHLYHSAPPYPSVAYRPTADIFPGDWSGPVAPTTLSAWQSDVDARRSELDRLATQISRKGIACTAEVDTASARAADGLLRCQRRLKADWIAVAGRSGRWSALILGSVSRIVAREAPCPVWVVRTEGSQAVEARPRKRGGAAKAA